MEGSNDILKRVNLLISKIIKINNELRKENSILLAERDRLMKDKVRLSELVKGYQKNEKVENIYQSFSANDDTKRKAKRQIEKILREIDDCLDNLKGRG